ncbi:MAG: hypothetical protein ACK2TV_14700 [Anaerolineales bacterium]
MNKKSPKFLLLTVLIVFFLTGCQALPGVFELFTPTDQEQLPSTTTPFIHTATSVSPTINSQIDPTDVQPTETVLLPTLTPTATPFVITTFVPQENMPVYLTNFAHPSAGCNWLGVAGQVFDTDGGEIHDLTMMFGNTLAEEEKVSAARTGLALAYGPGGYEIFISEKPFDSNQSLWLQVFDPAGHPISEKIFFDTYNDCNRNLILINFIPENSNYQPTLESTPEPETDTNAYP